MDRGNPIRKFDDDAFVSSYFVWGIEIVKIYNEKHEEVLKEYSSVLSLNEIVELVLKSGTNNYIDKLGLSEE